MQQGADGFIELCDLLLVCLVQIQRSKGLLRFNLGRGNDKKKQAQCSSDATGGENVAFGVWFGLFVLRTHKHSSD